MRQHLVSVHRMTPERAEALMRGHGGNYEHQSLTPDGGRIALDHQEAARKAMLQKQSADLMDTPIIVAPEPKKELHLPDGWLDVGDGTYTFEQKLSEKHSIDSIISTTIKGQVTDNHAIANVLESIKDISLLTESEDKVRILSARLRSYVPGDPEYPEISRKLYEATQDVKAFKQNLLPEITTELVYEQYYNGEFGSNEHIVWQEEQMKRITINIATT